MKKYKFQISGKTEDNKTVIKNVFKLFDTYGLPFFFILEIFKKRNLIIDWESLIIDCKQAGWKESKIKSTILEAIIDSEYFIENDYIEFKKRLDLYFGE